MDPVWEETRARLEARDQPKWESLSWLALRPLIDSINDRVNALCPQLVPDLRQAWVHQFDGGEHERIYDGVVDRGSTTSFVLMGDTGEQDASQYAVGTALREVMFAPDGTMKHDFALICSDVIYPSGDVNDYVHGFYLPYERVLHEARPAGPQPARFYALPGNHDWYDGLTGFMHTFCDRPALDPSRYGWPSPGNGGRTGLLEAVGRLVWRRPSEPMPARLHRGEPKRPLAQIRAEAVPAPSPGTGQPGPYFAIRLDGLLLVCIDAGIGSDGNSWIDAEQGRWLLRVSARPGPKLLLTGYPLLVNAEWKQCLIRGDGWHGPPSVNAVVADPAHGYVASIGGDTHNFEHYDTRVGPDAHPMTYLVAGGGGAYLSATHPIASAARVREDRTGDVEAIRAANELRGGPPTPADVTAGRDAAARAAREQRALGPLPNLGNHPAHGRHGVQLPMIPSAEASMAHFTEQVLPKTWRMLRAALSFVGGGLLASLTWDDARRADRLLTVCLVTLTIAVVVRALRPTMAPPRRNPDRGRLHAYRAGVAVAAAVAGASTVLAARWSSPAHGLRYLGAWAVLTLAAAVFGLLQRRSGWWREPGVEREGDHAASSAGVFGLVLVAAAVALHLLFDRTLFDRTGFDRTGFALIVAAVQLLVVVAAVGWLVRSWSRWRAMSQTVALITQLVAAADVLSVPGPQPLEVLLGVLLDAALVLLALAVSVGLAVLVARTRARSHAGGWRAAIGRSHYVVPTVFALLLAALAALAAWDPAQAFRVCLITGWALGLLVMLVFAVDLLRRRHPSAYRYIATPAVALILTSIGWGARHGYWLAGGLVVAAITGVLLVLTVAAGYLAFLGGHHLLLDWPAHQDRADRSAPLLSPGDAHDVVQWRRTGRGEAQVPPVARGRAKFVFPSTDQPQGLIQRKVSEFFGSDSPPFFQHVLTLSVVGDHLEITPLLITGLAPAVLPQPTVVVPLSGDAASVRDALISP